MRDKLIEILYNGFHVSPKDDLNGVVQKAADYLIAHGVTVQEWEPVSERLPEYDNFLVATNYGSVGEAFTLDGKIYWQEEAANSVYEIGIYGVPIEEVTHWMPLPAAPKEVE